MIGSNFIQVKIALVCADRIGPQRLMPSLQPCLAEEMTKAAALKAEDTAAEEPKA